MNPIHDPGELYSASEISDLLEEAERLGFDLDRDVDFMGRLSIRDLDILVHRVQ